MTTRISPTTIIGYVRLLAALVIVAKPLWEYWTVKDWNAASATILALGALALVNAVISAIAGHFTADSPPSPKLSDAGPTNQP